MFAWAIRAVACAVVLIGCSGAGRTADRDDWPDYRHDWSRTGERIKSHERTRADDDLADLSIAAIGPLTLKNGSYRSVLRAQPFERDRRRSPDICRGTWRRWRQGAGVAVRTLLPPG